MAKVYGKNSLVIFSIPLFIYLFFSIRTNIMPYFTSFASKRLIAFSSAFLISSMSSRQFWHGKVSNIRNNYLITTLFVLIVSCNYSNRSGHIDAWSCLFGLLFFFFFKVVVKQDKENTPEHNSVVIDDTNDETNDSTILWNYWAVRYLRNKPTMNLSILIKSAIIWCHDFYYHSFNFAKRRMFEHNK